MKFRLEPVTDKSILTRPDLLDSLLDQAEARLADSGPAGDGGADREQQQDRPFEAPLTTAQERLWYLEQIDPDPETFIRAVALRLVGPLDPDLLVTCLNTLIARHELLRAHVLTRAGLPVLRILPPSDVQIDLDIREVDIVDETVLRRALADPAMHIDGEHAPMLSGRLYRLSAQESVLLLTLHHTIVDAWSAEVVRSDLATIHSDLSRGERVSLPDLTVHPSFLAAEQRRMIGAGRFDEGVDRIVSRIRDHGEGLEFAPDRIRPTLRAHRGEAVVGRVENDLTRALSDLAASRGATLYMVLAAAYAVLVWRWTGKTAFSLGTPSAGRQYAATESLVGFLINRLVIDAELQPEAPFTELLDRIRAQTLDALSTVDVPFELVLDRLAPAGEVHRPPLVQTTFNLESIPRRPSPSGPVSFESIEVPHHVAPFDLSVEVRPAESGLDISFIYNVSLFSRWSIERMEEHYDSLLRSIVTNPTCAVDRMALMPAQRRQQILADWSDGGALEMEDVGIVDLFERMVDRAPDAPAVICRDEALSYLDLDRAANRLAHHLVEKGAVEDATIAVKLERSIDMVTAFLAIMKAGAIYVPIDLIHPSKRQQELVEQTSCSIVITDRRLAEEVEFEGRRIIRLDVERKLVDAYSGDRIGLARDPADMAYIVFTSGSTGRPKGVPTSHRSVVRFLHSVRTAAVGPDQRHLWISAPGFDMSNYQYWGALLFGGCCVISWEEPPTPLEIARTIERHGVTTVRTTASFFNLLIDEVPESLQSLQFLTNGGESMSVEHTRRAMNLLPVCRFANWYGPTETVSSATEFGLDDVPDHTAVSIPIGRPMIGRTAYILDSHLEPLPPGVPGDLFIGGSIMAEGYLDDPAATEARFIPDPFSTDPGAVMYQTGDRSRWLEGGNIEFLGRADRQLKIRGFRVEPGEVESAISRMPGVKYCAVVPVEFGAGGLSLAAFVLTAPDAALTEEDCRRFLSERIANHLVPAVWSFVDTLPTTSSGKTDYGRLTVEARSIVPDVAPSRAPETPTEKRLASIWSDVLAVANPGAEDDFFQSGGHSLLAAKLYVGIEREFDIQIPIATLFSAPTIASLSSLLDEERDAARWPTLVPIRAHGRTPAFFLVAQGNVVGFENVANRLDDRAFYVFHHPAVHREPLLDISIEEMAEHFLRELRKVQKTGPYLLGGWCAGSAVAFEMARRLRLEGEDVPLLAIMDSIRPPGVVGPDGKVVHPMLIERSDPQRTAPAPRHLKLLGRIIRKTRTLMLTEHRRKTGRIRTAMVRARSRYRPSSYDGPVTLFQANPHWERVTELQALWPKVTTGEFTSRRLDCKHHDLWTPANADQTAAALSEEIARALGP